MAKLAELKKQTLTLQLSIREDGGGGKTYGYYLPSGFIACESLGDLTRSVAVEIAYLEERFQEEEA